MKERGGRRFTLFRLALRLGHIHSDLAAFELEIALANHILHRGATFKGHVSKLFAVRNENLQHLAVLHHSVFDGVLIQPTQTSSDRSHKNTVLL
jgi:hypothetical protein